MKKSFKLASLVLLPVLAAPVLADDPAGTLTNSKVAPAQFLANERVANLKMATGSESRSAEVFYKTGSLGAGKAAEHNVALKAGQAYGVYVDCAPTSCRDVNMEILLNGKVVDEDHLEDTYPLLHIRPEKNATYTVRAKMKACQPGRSTCEYHVQVIRKP